MKICPWCGNKYPDDVTVCSIEGTALVDYTLAMAAAKSESEPLSKSRPDSNVNEEFQLRARAEVLQLLAWLFLAGGVLCILGAGIVIVTSVEPAPITPLVWIYIGGSACSAAVLFFFFAQLIHIRALLAKRN